MLLLLSVIPLRAQEMDIAALPAAPWATLGGGINASSTLYSSSGIESRQQPVSWLLSGSIAPTVKGIALPMTFIVSEKERDFRQAFNVVGISPRYEWITAHAGFRTMNFSKYTLAGAQFLGGGLELRPGNFVLAGMYGRFQRAVEDDSTQPLNLPAYERNGYAGQIGYRAGDNRATLSFLQAWDDTASLRKVPASSSLTPKYNTVLGVEFGVAIIPGQISIDAEGGASALTNDLRSPDLKDDDGEVPEWVHDFQPLKISTTLRIAGRAGLNLNFSGWGVRLGYERVDPEFTSLGAYYFNTDLENYTIAPRFQLDNLSVNGSFGLQRDNLEQSKLATTSRVIGSGSIDWRASETFGIGASFSNYSTGQSAGRRPLDDTIAVRNVTRSASLMPRLIIQDEKQTQSFSAGLNYQDFTDLNAFTSRTTDNSSLSATLAYSLGLIESGISAGASLTWASTGTTEISNELIGVNLNGSSTLFDDLLTASLSVGVSRVGTSGTITGSAVNINESLTLGYAVTPADNVTLSAFAMQNSASGDVASFNEMQATIGYSRSFNFVP